MDNIEVNKKSKIILNTKCACDIDSAVQDSIDLARLLNYTVFLNFNGGKTEINKYSDTEITITHALNIIK